VLIAFRSGAIICSFEGLIAFEICCMPRITLHNIHLCSTKTSVKDILDKRLHPKRILLTSLCSRIWCCWMLAFCESKTTICAQPLSPRLRFTVVQVTQSEKTILAGQKRRRIPPALVREIVNDYSRLSRSFSSRSREKYYKPPPYHRALTFD